MSQKKPDTVGQPISPPKPTFLRGLSMVVCLQRSHRRGAIFDSAEFANSIPPFNETHPPGCGTHLRTCQHPTARRLTCSAPLPHTPCTVDACVLRRASAIMPAARSGLARAPQGHRATPSPPPGACSPHRTASLRKEASPMSTHPHTLMARRFVEDTGAKHMTLRRSTIRQALGALVGGLVLLSLGVLTLCRPKGPSPPPVCKGPMPMSITP